MVKNLQCRKPRFDPWDGEIPLKKGMANHSIILAWRIPWTEEPGGVHRVTVRHNGATNTFTLSCFFVTPSYLALHSYFQGR